MCGVQGVTDTVCHFHCLPLTLFATAVMNHPQVVEHGGLILEKPEDDADAFRVLSRCGG